MEWGNPDAFWWLLLLPLLALTYGAYLAWRARAARRLARRPALARFLLRGSLAKQLIRTLLTLAAIALLIVTLARPQWGERQRTVQKEGIDIVFALDISRSMLAADATPSRLRAAKDELIRALSLLHGDRVGLVIFAGVAFPQAPLTADYGAIEFYLRRLDPEDMPVGGTASGRAILEAVELLTGERGAERARTGQTHAAPIKRAKNQIIVLISDGEDHQSDPIAAAKYAEERGIRIYTIGFGSEKGEPIPIYRDGHLTGYHKDRDGNTVTTRLNPQQLQDIAAITHGRYFHYDGRGSVANAVTTTLNDLEKDQLEALLRVQREERYLFTLLPALALLALALLLGERRGLRLAFWRPRPVSPDKHGDETQPLGPLLTLLIAAPLAALAAPGCDALHDTLVVHKVGAIEEGNALLAQGDPDKALLAYLEAERKLPSRPDLHYDLGTGHLAANHLPDAETALSRALESPDEDLRYKAHFNLGVAYFNEEKWKEALEAFKACLRLKPDDQDAKIAYEVALLRVYPACRSLEDPAEDNDQPQNATPLQNPEVKAATLCGGDPDWFAQPVYPGSILRATATFKRLRPQEPGDPALLPRADMLRLALIAPDGQSLLTEDPALPLPDDAAPHDPAAETVTRTLGPLRLTPENLRLPPPYNEQNALPVLVRVDADAPLEFTYDLKIDVIPPCFALEDDYEDNDDAQAAAPLKPDVDQPVHLCKNDDDWYAITLQPGDNLFIDVTPALDAETERIPDLDVTLFDEDGATPISATERLNTPQGPLLGVQLRDVQTTRTVKLRVRGADGQQQGPYTLHLYHYPPCEAGGDDRFEDNDRPDQTANLPRGQGPTRHLRLCPGDVDFFRIDAKKDDRVELGIRYDELPEDADAPPDAPPVLFRLRNEAADTLLAESQPVQVAPPLTSPVQRVLASEPVEEEKAAFTLEVASPAPLPRFYSLIPMEGDRGQDQQQQQQDSQDQAGDPQDGQDNPDQQDSQDGQAQDGQDGQDKQDKQDGDPQDKQDAQAQDKEDGQEQQQAAEAAARPEEDAKERRAEILQALEEGDDNFQLKKAVRDVPDRYIENDW